MASTFSFGFVCFAVEVNKGASIDLEDRDVGCVFLIRRFNGGARLNLAISHNTNRCTYPLGIHGAAIHRERSHIGDFFLQHDQTDIVARSGVACILCVVKDLCGLVVFTAKLLLWIWIFKINPEVRAAGTTALCSHNAVSCSDHKLAGNQGSRAERGTFVGGDGTNGGLCEVRCSIDNGTVTCAESWIQRLC